MKEINVETKPSQHETTDKELSCASDALFDEFTQGMRLAFKSTLSLTENIHDSSAAFFGNFLGNEAKEKHTKHLEDEALTALKEGRIDAAKHFLKRDVAYTTWTQGYDDKDTQRLLSKIQLLNE